MLNKIFRSKSQKFLSVALALGLMFGLFAVQSVNAENEATNKAINVLGYELDVASTPDTLKVYLDKNMTIDTTGVGSDTYAKYQFKVFQGSTPVAISGVATTTGSGVSATDFPDATLPNGSTVTLTFSSALTREAEYTCVVSRTIRANNNLTVGDFIVDSSGNKTDRSFIFTPPDTDGHYHTATTVKISEMPLEGTSAGVPVEGNVGFIVDRVVTLADAVELTDHDSTGDLTLTDEDGTCVGNHCYNPMYVHSRTGFFFPLTYGDYYSDNYNLKYNSAHSFGIPTFYDINGHSYSNTIDFTTAAADIPGKFTATPTYSDTTLDWVTTDLADSYNVYRSSYAYWGFTGTPEYSDTPDYYSGCASTSGTFVRVEAVNSYGKSGLSMYYGF